MNARSRFRLASLLGSTLAAAFVALPAHAAEIVLATWGGSWGKAIAEQAVAPFEKATGVKVRVISGVSLANMHRSVPNVSIVSSMSGRTRSSVQSRQIKPMPEILTATCGSVASARIPLRQSPNPSGSVITGIPI